MPVVIALVGVELGASGSARCQRHHSPEQLPQAVRNQALDKISVDDPTPNEMAS
jgi:hypothetical protein